MFLYINKNLSIEQKLLMRSIDFLKFNFSSENK